MSTNPFPINHDLHTHTSLSACCADHKLTGAFTAKYAGAHGYATLCFTDHFWDAEVPGASAWYAPQDINHVKKLLPLPKAEGVNVLFGCETEYCGGKKLGIAPSHYDQFDMIVIPVNHFHMPGFVRPEGCDTEEGISELLISRLEELASLDLPWSKVGIAHLNGCIFPSGERYERALALIPEVRLRSAFSRFARRGAGIELNASCFATGWMDNRDGGFRLLRTALEEGCRFYCASDAHTRDGLDSIARLMRAAADALGLTADDLFLPS